MSYQRREHFGSLQCYSTISKAYHAVPRAALGYSDHVMVHLTPAYRQKLKRCKPVVRTSKQWTREAMGQVRVRVNFIVLLRKFVLGIVLHFA